jgi:hypothetical protein
VLKNGYSNVSVFIFKNVLNPYVCVFKNKAFVMKTEINETLFKIKYEDAQSTSLFGDRGGSKIEKEKKRYLIKILTNKNDEVFDVLISW